MSTRFVDVFEDPATYDACLHNSVFIAERLIKASGCSHEYTCFVF